MACRAQVEPPEAWGGARAIATELARLGYAVVEWQRGGRPVFVLFGSPAADPWSVPPID